MLRVAETAEDEVAPFVQSLARVPKSGLHNPFKRPERYLLYGQVTRRAAEALHRPEVEAFFVRLIQRVAPKSHGQAFAEVKVTRHFLENFGGDNVRFLARSFQVPGDHAGQMSGGYRWPFGPVALIAPFNFPLEIPALQLLGALYMGNKPLVHVDSKVSVVVEQFLRLLIACGMPPEDVDLLNGPGATMHAALLAAEPRTTLFTGSQRVAEQLAVDLKGKVKLEDAGFDWKILGPDVPAHEHEVAAVASTCDQDAYAFSGQKCSAQSILFAHEAWTRSGVDIEGRLRALAGSRRLADLTVGPVLSRTTASMLQHVDALLEIPGARVAFGGKELGQHSIPACYGALEPTAVHVPLEAMMATPEAFATATTEIFGPFQVLTTFSDAQVPLVLAACERMTNHLTAAVVSQSIPFLQTVLANTVNGTTYAGLRARTTGAPQNHWFGPAGDPRGAGIGSREAIQLVWSSHREIVQDVGPVPPGSPLPQS